MDPDEILSNMRLALTRFENARDMGEDGDEVELDALREIAEGFQALDGWLHSGGFLPKRWHPAYEPTRST